MNNVYTIAAYNLEEMGARGRGHVAVKVQGYWSQDPITIYVRRESPNWRNESMYEWQVDISHSSCGRDKDVVASDIDAATNFGMALIAAGAEARVILAQHETIERAYQAQREVNRQERAVVEAQRQERIAADEVLGEDVAGTMIGMAIATAQTTRDDVTINAFDRGADTLQRLTVRRTRSGMMTLMWGVSRVSRQEAITKLAASSNRSTTVVNA